KPPPAATISGTSIPASPALVITPICRNATGHFGLRPQSLVFRHSGWKTRVPLGRRDKRGTDDNEEKGKELATLERADHFGIGLTEIFHHDSKNCVTNEKQSGQNAIGLARSRPHKPQDREQHDTLEESFIELRWMARRQN